MVLHGFVRTAAASLALVLALPAFAGNATRPIDDVPNVLVVKTPLDQDGRQKSDAAALIPVKIELPKDAQDRIDYDQLAAAVDRVVDAMQPVPLDAAAYDATKVPDGVTKLFDNADKVGPTEERLSWRVWTPWGTVANNGFYGYGYGASWGYDRDFAWNPSYGFYDGYFNYPYTYSFYRPYNGFGWNYYIR